MSYLEGDKMNRDKWEFNYLANELADAAKKKAEYRTSRENWWLEQKAAAMVKVKDGGISVSESLASSYTSNSGRGPQVMVRADLQANLMECHNKIIEHNRAARDYRGWEAVLRAQPATMSFTLLHADWLYFFGDDAVLAPDAE